MAQVVDPNKNLIKLESGKTVTAQTGGWYDGQQYWNGSLSQPGQINTQSNQQGAGGLVSKEVIAQTNPNNVAYIDAQRAKMNLTPSPTSGVPSVTNTPTGAVPTTATPSGGLSGLTGAFSNKPSIDLPNLYNSLYQSSGITEQEASLRDKEAKFLKAKGEISDNPFSSAGMVDQRLQRLQRKYDEETLPIRNEIETKKADIETKLNLETKQFDINSETAKNALSYFNTLLSAGALDTATGEDIAQITRATGLSSSIIKSAVDSRKQSKAETQVITSTSDDGTVTATVINPKTGDIVQQTSLGKVGNKQGSGSGLSVSQQQEADAQANRTSLASDVQRGATLSQVVGHYGGVLTIEEIYRIYNTYSPYGKAQESLEQVKEGKFKV